MAQLGRFGRGGLQGFQSAAESAFAQDLPPGTDIRAAVDRIGKRELAEHISGTNDHSSREYKNARDYISRHLRGSRRTVTGAHAERIEDALRENELDRLRNREELHVEIEADITVSKRTWHGRMKTDLRGAALRDYIDAVENGRGREAMSVFLDQYGGGQMGTVRTIANIRDVSYR